MRMMRVSQHEISVRRQDSGSEAVTESSDDEGVTGRLSDAAAAAAYGRTLIC